MTPGGPVPDAPGERLLPFRVATVGVIHLRIAFLGDPMTGTTSPSGSLGNTKISLVPAHEITVGGLLVNESAVPLNSDWLTVGNSVFTKGVVGGYAQFQGGAPSAGAGNVWPVTLTISGSAPSGAIDATWFLVIKSDIQLWITFAVTEDPADPASAAELPWIHVPTASTVVGLPGPFVPGTMVNPAGMVSGICNFGPGALDIAATDVTEGDGTDTVSVVAGSIGAATTGSIELGYTANDGISSLTVDIASNDPTNPGSLVGDYHNARIGVSAESAGIADTVLVLDASGSMILRPDGVGDGDPMAATPAGRRRWDNLVAAADHLAFGYVSFLTSPAAGGAASPSRLGVAVFPDVLGQADPDWWQSAAELVGSAEVSAALADEIHDKLVDAGAALDWGGWTPMGDAIGVAMGTDMSSAGMFEPETDAHRRWMVLMTDGNHNAGTLHPNQFYLPDSVVDFVSKQVRLYSIGYTTEAGGTAVGLLNDLADHALNPVDGSGLEESQYAQAAVTSGFEKDLSDTFLDALAVSIGLSPTFDPPGTLSDDEPIAIHEFQVTPYDTGVGVFLDWHTLSASRIHMTLISPRCESFDQDTMIASDGFEFRAFRGYSHAFVSNKILSDGGKGQPRYGTWKLVLELGKVDKEFDDGDGVEPYKFSIYNRTGLRLRRGSMAVRSSTAKPLELVTELRAHGAPVSGAQVVATVDFPTADYGRMLAGADVSSEALDEARARLKDKYPDTPGLWALKAQVIAENDKRGPIEVSRTKRSFPLLEVAPGEYRATLPGVAAVAGVYSAQVVATSCAGEVPFRRECAITTVVEAVPSPERTLVGYEFGDKDQLTIHIRPRDVHDNPVIVNIDKSPRLVVEVAGGKRLTELRNQLDGTYSQTFSLAGADQPLLRVSFDGKTVIKAQPLPKLDSLVWMARVVRYQPGEVKPSDPKCALGQVAGPKDAYVEIGPGGGLQLGDARSHFYATHVVVFAPPGLSQPYQVFATSPKGKRPVPIGVGDGATQVFPVSSSMPIASILITPARKLGKPVAVQGVGYVLGRRKLAVRWS